MVTEINTQRIIDGFWDHSLPAEEWTHMAHLIVGLHTAINHNLDTSINLLRDGISQYNLAAGTKNTDSGGYHETITVFFAHAMQAYVKQFKKGASFDLMVDRLSSTVLIQPSFMLSFFSKDRLFSVAARRSFMAPDLRPLVELKSGSFWPEVD